MKKNITNPEALKTENPDETTPAFEILAFRIEHSHNVTRSGTDYELYHFQFKLLNMNTKEEIDTQWLASLYPTAKLISKRLDTLLRTHGADNRTIN